MPRRKQNAMALRIGRPRLSPAALPSIVLPRPRFEHLGARTVDSGLQVEVGVNSFEFGPLGSIRATARFTSFLDLPQSDRSPGQRAMTRIEADTAGLRRHRLGHAGTTLLLAAPPLSSLQARIGSSAGQGARLVRAMWSDLVVMDPDRRLLTRIPGEWIVYSARIGSREGAPMLQG